MYLFIFEDGTIKKSVKVSDEDEQAIGYGLVDIIDITDPNRPLFYYDCDDWRDLDSVDEL